MRRTTSTDWWGFRLYAPDPEAAPPVNLMEALSLVLTINVGALVVWLAVVLLVPGLGSRTLLPWISLNLAVPIVLPIASVAVVAGTALNKNARKTGVAWLLLARDRGRTFIWDRWIGLIAVAAVVGLLIRSGHAWFTAAVFLAAETAFLMFVLQLAEPGSTLRRTWPFRIPDWHRDAPREDEEGEEERRKKRETKEVPGPESEANPIYQFAVGKDRYPMGIRIPAEVLARLRQFNIEAAGALYQKHTEAVVLVDRAPIEGVGQSELLRLTGQIVAIARRHELSPLALANQVLAFVQSEFSYSLDIDSTGDIPGGAYPEYGRFALETLSDGTGDCECTSILCAALMAYLGLSVCLVFVLVIDSDTGEEGGHVAVGLAAEELLSGNLEGMALIEKTDEDGAIRRFLYGETAIDGGTMAFGVLPSMDGQKMRVRRVVAIPTPRISS